MKQAVRCRRRRRELTCVTVVYSRCPCLQGLAFPPIRSQHWRMVEDPHASSMPGHSHLGRRTVQGPLSLLPSNASVEERHVNLACGGVARAGVAGLNTCELDKRRQAHARVRLGQATQVPKGSRPHRLRQVQQHTLRSRSANEPSDISSVILTRFSRSTPHTTIWS